MNIKHPQKINSEHRSITRSGAALKGALLWGTVYSTAATGAVYAVASNVNTEPLTLSHVAADSMAMFYPFGAARGLLMQKMKKKRIYSGLDRKTLRWLNKRLPRRSRSKST